MANHEPRKRVRAILIPVNIQEPRGWLRFRLKTKNYDLINSGLAGNEHVLGVVCGYYARWCEIINGQRCLPYKNTHSEKILYCLEQPDVGVTPQAW